MLKSPHSNWNQEIKIFKTQKAWPNGHKENGYIKDKAEGTTEQDFPSWPNPFPGSTLKIWLYILSGKREKSGTLRVRVGNCWDITQLSNVLHSPLSRFLGSQASWLLSEALSSWEEWVLEEYRCLCVQDLIIRTHIVLALLWTPTFFLSPWPPCSLKSLLTSDLGPSVADTASVLSFLLWPWRAPGMQNSQGSVVRK